MVEQRSVRSQLEPFIFGRVLSPAKLNDLLDASFGSRTAQLEILTAADPVQDDYEYSYFVEGEKVSFTSGTDATAAEVAEGLAAAHNGNILASASFTAEADGDDLELTGKSTFTAYRITVDDPELEQMSQGLDRGEMFPIAHPVYVSDGLAQYDVPAGEDHETAIRGVSCYRYDEEKRAIADPLEEAHEFVQGDRLQFIRTGVVAVPGGANADYGDQCYIGTDGDEENHFFAEDGATREAVDGLTWDGPHRLRVQL